MNGGPGKFILIIVAILLIIDIYTFRGLRHFFSNMNDITRWSLTIIYWLVPAIIIAMTLYVVNRMSGMLDARLFYRTIYTMIGIMVLFYVPKLIFSAFELGNDLVNACIFLFNRFNVAQNIANVYILKYIGAFVAAVLFFFTFYGIIHGRYHYKVNRLELKYSNLPEKFTGFKIVQISDWHIGSYYKRPERVQEAVEKINSLEPDVILFTGDLVNNLATEVDEFMPEIKQLKAKYGKYSILGNHDYGEYVNWPNAEEKQKNIGRLETLEKEAGFVLLKNQFTEIVIDGQKIGLIGVENWGLPPFPQYGNLEKAMAGSDSSKFNILLSHDPSHWDAEVKEKTNIDLTLSGHTHGMQFGFIFGNLKWSPVKHKYPRWAGLYSNNNQKLYVNVGIGYIGFPGRVGIRPEITLIELKKK